MKRKICELLMILFFYILQVTFGRSLSIGGIKPNMLIIFPVIFGYLNGHNEGMLTGLFAGLLYDLYFSELFGFTALIYVYIGYIAGGFYQKFNENEILVPLAVLLTGDFCYGFLSYIGNFLLHNRLNVFYYISRFILPEIIYTLILTIVLYKPFVFINSKLNASDRSSRSVKKRRKINFD